MPRKTRIPPPRGPGQPQKYPWDQWLDGTNKILTQGIDFDSQLDTVSSLLYKMAKKRGLRLVTNVYQEEGEIVLYFPDEEQG